MKKPRPRSPPAAELRRRAEEQLRARTTGAPGVYGVDRERLIQELEIHQIELETQNEELRRAQETLEASLIERDRATKVLRESEERLRLFVEHAPAAVAMFDRGMNYLAASRRFATDLRLKTCNLVGRNHYDVFPDLPSRWREIHKRCLAGAVEACEEDPYPRADGTVDWVRWEIRPWRSDDGEIGGIVLFSEIITERKRAEEALRAANAQLAEADRQKSEFLAVLSHELRNALAPIHNSIYLLEHAAPGSGAVRRAPEVLRRQTEHLTRLVNDLLDMTRITRGEFELQLARIDARDVVRLACSDSRNAFEQKAIKLAYSETVEPTWVDADPVRLAQMVGNLLHNALKFTESGGVVNVVVRKREARCEISVRDTGMGIDPADVDRIFGPFVKAESTRHAAQGGMGIGLALVRNLAMKHGGSVRAVSEGPGKGAEFVLEFPLTASVAPPASARGKGARASSLAILVVEDNEDTGATLADMLELSGHKVRVVGTGRAGVEATSVNVPDVLICDIGLPDLSGFEVIRAIRAAHPASAMFAIAFSGYADRQDRDEALGAGFDAHLAKPASLDELDELLIQAANKRSHTSSVSRV